MCIRDSFIAPRGLSSAAMIPIVAAAVIAAGQTEVANSMVNIVFMVILLSTLFSTVVGMMAKMERFIEEKMQKKKDKKEQKYNSNKKFNDLSLMIEEEDK